MGESLFLFAKCSLSRSVLWPCAALGVWFQAKSELIERRAEGQLRFDAKIRKKLKEI